MVRINEPVTIKPASERLELLYRITQTINSSLDLEQVMEVLVDEVLSATNAERGFLMTFDAEGDLVMRKARGLHSNELESSAFEVSRGIINRVAGSGMPLLTSNAQLDDRFNNRESIRLYGLRSVICVPMQVKDKRLGVIYIDNRFQNGIFSEDDLDLLNSIAASAGIAIENARLYQLAVDQGRMQRELQMAREVQSGLIPTETPNIKGWEFATCWKPAYEVSGDFFDFIPLPSGKLGLIVADVSDKGMPAALFMTLSRSIIRSVVGQNGLPSEDISKANSLIFRDAAEKMFITFFYGEIDFNNNILTYVNAGHNPPIFISGEGAEQRLLPKTGMAAGVEPDITYNQETISFDPGDRLVIYTDGVTDAEIQGGTFDLLELRKTLSEMGSLGASATVENLENKICSYSKSEIPSDDITIVVVKRLV